MSTNTFFYCLDVDDFSWRIMLLAQCGGSPRRNTTILSNHMIILFAGCLGPHAYDSVIRPLAVHIWWFGWRHMIAVLLLRMSSVVFVVSAALVATCTMWGSAQPDLLLAPVFLFLAPPLVLWTHYGLYVQRAQQPLYQLRWAVIVWPLMNSFHLRHLLSLHSAQMLINYVLPRSYIIFTDPNAILRVHSNSLFPIENNLVALICNLAPLTTQQRITSSKNDDQYVAAVTSEYKFTWRWPHASLEFRHHHHMVWPKSCD